MTNKFKLLFFSLAIKVEAANVADYVPDVNLITTEGQPLQLLKKSM